MRSSREVARRCSSTRTAGPRRSSPPCGGTAGKPSPSSAFPCRTSSMRLTPPSWRLERKELLMPGLLRGMARTAVVAGTATSVSNRVSRRQASRWAEQDQAYAEPAPAPAAPAPDPIEQLQKLGALHQQGVLTDEEFAQQKARLLA